MESAVNKQESYGIEQTLEILDFLGLLAEKLLRAGTMSKLELMRYALSEEFRRELSEAIEGSSEAPKEWGDVSGFELVMILQRIIGIAGRIAAAKRAAA